MKASDWIAEKANRPPFKGVNAAISAIANSVSIDFTTDLEWGQWCRKICWAVILCDIPGLERLVSNSDKGVSP